MLDQKREKDFIQQADQSQPGVLRELWQWMRHSKKWWLLPIVIGLLVVGLFVLLSGTAIAPFIYTLF